MNKVVIVGCSAAGHSLALQLRSRNKGCSITVVTEEAFPPYDRRKLLSYFAGTAREKELFIAGPEPYARENITFIKETQAVGANCDRGTLFLKKKDDRRENIPFDLLAVCTGKKTVRPEIPGIRKEGIFTFDTLADIKAAKSMVINGPVCLFGEWNAKARALAELFVAEKREIKLVSGNAPAQLPGAETINSTIVEMIGESGLQAVKLREGKIIGSCFCVLTGPSAAAADFLGDTGILGGNGSIPVDGECRSSRPNVFACGPVTGGADSWEEAVRQAEKLSETLAQLLS
jgi:NAD(P)H-nitrite reductase large subunit